MPKLTVGKLRGLQQIANDKGILTVCAIDHRESLRQALNEKNPDSVSYRQMVDFKLDLVSVIAPFASAVLLDPIYGAGQAVASGLLPGQTGLLVSAEKTGYSGDSTARITALLPDWDVKKAKKRVRRPLNCCFISGLMLRMWLQNSWNSSVNWPKNVSEKISPYWSNR